MKKVTGLVLFMLIVLSVLLFIWFVGAGVKAQDVKPERPLRWDTGEVITWDEFGRLSSGRLDKVSAQGTNIQVNRTGPAAETTIIINPTNPNHLIAAAMDSSSASVRGTPYISLDGGQTWAQQNPLLNFVQAPDGTQKQFQNQSDPVLTADSRGNIYFATIMWETGGPDNGVYVFKSTSGGRRFLPGVAVEAHIGEENPPFEDKEWITADTTGGPYNDSLYISWTSLRRSSEPNMILFSRSIDGGSTFSTPQAINDDQDPGSGVQGSMPQVGPNGEAYVAWLHFAPNRPTEIVIDKSTDGGVTFGVDVSATTVSGFGRLRGLARHGGSLPSLAVDRTSGPHRGNLYLVWADSRNGDVDVLLTRSTDGGLSWSPPLRVNDDPLRNGKDQFMPFVTVDQVTGGVVVGYYDRRDSVENFLVNYRVTWSGDGGARFQPSVNLTDQSFDPSAAFRFIQAANFVCQAPFLGDYTSLTAWGGVVYPLWADTREP